MKKSLQISEKRQLVKQEITSLIEETLPARILQIVGSLIQRMTGQINPPPWYVSTIVLIILSLLPQTLIALILKQPEQVIGQGWIWSSSNLITIPIIPVFYLVTKYILIITRDHIVDEVKESNDLDDLWVFLAKIGNLKQALVRAFVASILWSVVAISIFSFLKHEFIGPSYSIDVWIWGFCALGIGSYYLGWLMHFPNRLKNYHYNLYEVNPSRSEVITHISTIFTRPFYVTALYLAVGTFYSDLSKVFTWVVFVIVIVFWIPLIIQFINSQTAINKIIWSEKWRILNNLQEQIRKHKINSDFNSPEELEAIDKLMDLHEKVYNSKNTQLTINSIFDFLNQLILPLLAFVISNYADILKFFKLRP